MFWDVFPIASAVEISGESLFSTSALLALVTLTLMEIVLGIDNIVFIAIITGRLPPDQRSKARRIGLLLAMGMRIALLMIIGWIISLQEPLFNLADYVPIEPWREQIAADEEVNHVSVRDLILLGGGLFLLFTAVREIHHKIDGTDHDDETDAAGAGKISMSGVLFRIAVMDVIFSLDSVITAVGMAEHIEIMVAAVVVSVGVMIVFANQISDFVATHPSVKMLALSFLILIGVVLVSESAGTPISKGYVYFAMAFSLGVEFLNLRAPETRVKATPTDRPTDPIEPNPRANPSEGE